MNKHDDMIKLSLISCISKGPHVLPWWAMCKTDSINVCLAYSRCKSRGAKSIWLIVLVLSANSPIYLTPWVLNVVEEYPGARLGLWHSLLLSTTLYTSSPGGHWDWLFRMSTLAILIQPPDLNNSWCSLYPAVAWTIAWTSLALQSSKLRCTAGTLVYYLWYATTLVPYIKLC